MLKSIFGTPPKKIKQEDMRVTPLGSDFNVGQCVVTSIPAPIIAAWSKDKPRLAIVIDNVLSPAECAQWIKDTEQFGYEEALVNIGGGRQQKMTDIRNSSRRIVDDAAAAAQVWNRVKSFVPEDYDIAYKPVEVNERLRFLRYDPGEYFAPHFDGCYERPNGDFSILTIQIYLNEGFEGGATRFFDRREREFYDVVPKTGSVLIFDHPMLHSGEVLVKGRKYAVRSDIMYTKRTKEELAVFNKKDKMNIDNVCSTTNEELDLS